MKILVTTLVTSKDYLGLAQVLAHGLKNRFKSKYDFKILITQNVSLSDNDWVYHADYDIIPYLEYNSKNTLSKEELLFLKNYKTTINKFWVWTYTEYDYVVFIDADSFIVGDFDNFIENAISKYNSNFIGRFRDGDINNINSGFFIIKPDRDFYFKILNEYKFKVTDDETILFKYFKNNVTQDMHDLIMNNKSIIHTGSVGKIILMFPTIIRDLMLSDTDTYLLAIRTWIMYRQSHLMLDNKPDDKTFDYWWKLWKEC